MYSYGRKELAGTVQRALQLAVVTKCKYTRRILAAPDEFNQSLDLGPVECCVVYEFCELEVFSGPERAPWFVVWWCDRLRVVAQGCSEFLGTEGASTLLAVRVILDHDITSLRNPRTRSY